MEEERSYSFKKKRSRILVGFIRAISRRGLIVNIILSERAVLEMS